MTRAALAMLVMATACGAEPTLDGQDVSIPEPVGSDPGGTKVVPFDHQRPAEVSVSAGEARRSSPSRASSPK